ncbi:MAG TPA: hypothetical protein VNZ64_23385 [Candidatus Acidoferrum sp.]|jgi:hypothetical protein|nr:hypothetical protein [Candidatus Acidoferrum sp.]
MKTRSLVFPQSEWVPEHFFDEYLWYKLDKYIAEGLQPLVAADVRRRTHP